MPDPLWTKELNSCHPDDFPFEEARAAGVPDAHLAELLVDIRADALEDFATVVAAAPDAPLAGWRRFLEAGTCRGTMDVAFGLDRGRPEYVAAGLRALRLCAGE